MIKFKLVDGRTKVSRKIKELQEQLEQVQPEFLKETVTEIVLNSPVDTGTYMDAHNVGIVGAPASSRGKPRKQPFEPHANAALERMFGQIDSLPIGSNAFISNSAEHANIVEYELGHAPYTTARGRAEAILRNVISKIMRK